MNRKFSPKVKQIISHSRDEALRLGHDFIGTEHLLLGIVQEEASLAVRVLDSLDVDTYELKQTIEESIQRSHTNKASLNIGNLPLNKHAEKVLKVTFLEAKMLKNEEISPVHLLLSILTIPNLTTLRMSIVTNLWRILILIPLPPRLKRILNWMMTISYCQPCRQ